MIRATRQWISKAARWVTPWIQQPPKGKPAVTEDTHVVARVRGGDRCDYRWVAQGSCGGKETVSVLIVGVVVVTNIC